MIDIYVITNSVNNKKYIGQSIDSDYRWKDHKRSAQNGIDYPIYRAMRKYGIESFSFEVIESVDTQEDANLREDFWINELDTRNGDYGYNIRGGGATGLHAEETKKKISESHKQFYIDHPERRLEKGDPFRGSHLTEEQKQHLSEIHTGMTYPACPEEKKQRIAEGVRKASREHPWQTGNSDPEHIRKMTDALRESRENMTPEEKEVLSNRLREANKNQFSSEESRKRHSEIMKAYYAKKRAEKESQ
jgi:group I intron endonuclease